MLHRVTHPLILLKLTPEDDQIGLKHVPLIHAKKGIFVCLYVVN